MIIKPVSHSLSLCKTITSHHYKEEVYESNLQLRSIYETRRGYLRKTNKKKNEDHLPFPYLIDFFIKNIKKAEGRDYFFDDSVSNSLDFIPIHYFFFLIDAFLESNFTVIVSQIRGRFLISASWKSSTSYSLS